MIDAYDNDKNLQYIDINYNLITKLKHYFDSEDYPICNSLMKDDFIKIMFDSLKNNLFDINMIKNKKIIIDMRNWSHLYSVKYLNPNNNSFIKLLSSFNYHNAVNHIHIYTSNNFYILNYMLGCNFNDIFKNNKTPLDTHFIYILLFKENNLLKTMPSYNNFNIIKLYKELGLISGYYTNNISSLILNKTNYSKIKSDINNYKNYHFIFNSIKKAELIKSFFTPNNKLSLDCSNITKLIKMKNYFMYNTTNNKNESANNIIDLIYNNIVNKSIISLYDNGIKDLYRNKSNFLIEFFNNIEFNYDRLRIHNYNNINLYENLYLKSLKNKEIIIDYNIWTNKYLKSLYRIFVKHSIKYNAEIDELIYNCMKLIKYLFSINSNKFHLIDNIDIIIINFKSPAFLRMICLCSIIQKYHNTEKLNLELNFFEYLNKMHCNHEYQKSLENIKNELIYSYSDINKIESVNEKYNLAQYINVSIQFMISSFEFQLLVNCLNNKHKQLILDTLDLCYKISNESNPSIKLDYDRKLIKERLNFNYFKNFQANKF